MSRLHPFGEIFQSVADDITTRVKSVFATKCGNLTTKETLWQSLSDIVVEDLSELCKYVVWHEFNLVRDKDIYDYLLDRYLTQKHSTVPDLCIPTEIYTAFVTNNGFCADNSFWCKYPQFCKRLSTWIQRLEKSLLDCILDVNASLDSISAVFCDTNLDSLDLVEILDSDPHCGGRRIYLLVFSRLHSSSTCRVVYKQRSIDCEVFFYDAITIFNKYLPNKDHLGTIKCLPMRTHGFMEYVEHSICESSLETDAFYRNSGHLLSLLYALGVSDCHYENIISRGGKPFLVDCETILEPDTGSIHTSELDSSSYSKSSQDLFSVVSTGFILCLSGASTDESSYDLSAIGVSPDFSPNERIPWTYLNTDLMAISINEDTSELKTCLPSREGFASSPLHYSSYILQGFYHGYNALLDAQDELLTFLSMRSGINRRVLFRPTFVYATIQKQLRFPGILEVSDLFNDVLSGLKIASQGNNLSEITSSETAQLLELDIPYFIVSADSSAVCNPEGLADLTSIYSISGASSALHRIRHLSPKDCSLQCTLINASLIPSENLTVQTVLNATHFAQTSNIELITQLTSTVWSFRKYDLLGARTWISFPPDSLSTRLYPSPIGTSLYDGSLGLCLHLCRFLTFAHSYYTPDECDIWLTRLSRLLEDTLTSLENMLLCPVDGSIQFGISGIAGAILTVKYILNCRFVDETLSERLSQVLRLLHDTALRHIGSLDLNYRDIDYLNGISGIVSTLCSLYPSSLFPYLPTLSSALTLCLQVSTDSAQKQLYAPSLKSPSKILGISHGLGGQIHAIQKLLDIPNQQIVQQDLYCSFKESASFFSIETHKVFTRFLEASNSNYHDIAWCSGITGLLLVSASLVSSGHSNPSERTLYQKVINRIVKIVCEPQSRHPLHICCGSSGVLLALDICLTYGFSVDSDMLQEKWRSEVQRLYNSDCQLLNPKASIIFQPGLYSGLCGVAFTGMELMSRSELPSLLLS